jgi:hypothetical protein
VVLQEHKRKKNFKQNLETINLQPNQKYSAIHKPWFQGDAIPTEEKGLSGILSNDEAVTNDIITTQNISAHIQGTSGTHSVHTSGYIQGTPGTHSVHTSGYIQGTPGTHSVHTSGHTSGHTRYTQNVMVANKKSFTFLGKTQKEILFFIYNSCKDRLSKVSANISLDNFINCCKLSKKSIKTTLKRLEKNNTIILRSFKGGHQGFRQYELSEDTYKEISLIGESECLRYTLQGTLQGTSANVSSSNINTTTTNLPENFQKIDYYPLKDVGFDESHIIQIYREHKKNPELSLSAEIIQNSINAFAFDLKHNKIAGTFKNSPAVVLTSILKKGQPYSSKTPEKVLTPQEEAMQEYLLAQEKKQQKITEIKTKARELALQEWLDSLSEEELLNFNQELRPDGIPDRIYQKSRRKKAEDLAKDYFDTVLWPKQLKQILNPQVSLNETEIET